MINASKRPKFFQKKQMQKEKKQCDCSECLIVDDDIFNLIVLEQMLNKLGFTCKKAFNGQEAIDELKGYYNLGNKCNQNCKGYQIIWMDFQMPIMGDILFFNQLKDGITATNIISELIRNNELPKIPIIACTAFSSKDNIKNCYASGMQDYVSKHISLEKIKNVLKNYNLL